MNSEDFVVKRAHRHCLGRIASAIALAVLIWDAFSTGLAAEAPANPCQSEPMAEAFLQSMTAVMENRTEILTEPLRGYLQKLADSVGYRGSISDLDKLKLRSLELKKEPVRNRDQIALLDNAVASHFDELRPAVSYRALAAQAPPETDIFEDFLVQKLNFLRSKRAEFYDRGPFELVRRTLLAGAIESRYFLDLRDGNRTPRCYSGKLMLFENLNRDL